MVIVTKEILYLDVQSSGEISSKFLFVQQKAFKYFSILRTNPKCRLVVTK